MPKFLSPQLVIPLVVFGSVLWLFGRVLFTDESFAYRDGASFYGPLFNWATAEWKAGRIPLWSTQENTGTPVLADTTASLFYPGKLIYCLPLSWARCYAVYVVVHVLLAAGSAFLLARRWTSSVGASGIAALSYALSGPILFQYCNVVYLVSAAWMPIAWLAISAQWEQLKLRWTAVLAITLALMILGGDPQAAYHAILAALLLLGLQWRNRVRRRCAENLTWQRYRWIGQRAGLLLVAGLGAGLLAAVQVLPTAGWTYRSERALAGVPQSLYDVAAARAATPPSAPAVNATKEHWRTLLETPPAGTHARHVYWFSVGPWRLLEWFWPHFSGQRFPTHRRWIESLPAESPPWTPTLYMGLLPLLISLGSMRCRAGSLRWRWMSWTAILAILASFGWFGIGWVFHELRSLVTNAPTAAPLVSPPAGGVYWWLVVLLPGYAKFRFPAKLFALASLALSMLAARGWDRTFSSTFDTRFERQLKVRLLAISAFSLSAAAVIWPTSQRWGDWFAAVTPDLLFGPLQARQAGQDLALALFHTGVIAGLFWILIRWHRVLAQDHPARVKRWTGVPIAAAFVLTAVELVVVHQPLIQSAPLAAWQAAPAAEVRIRAGATDPVDSTRDTGRVFRGRRSGWGKPGWQTVSSAQRLAETVRWDRDTLRSRYHLETGLALVESETTIRPVDYSSLLRIGRQLGWTRPDGVTEPHPLVLNALGARYWLLPANTIPPGTDPSSADDRPASRPVNRLYQSKNENWALWENPNRLPRVWLVRRWQTLNTLIDPSRKSVDQRTRFVFFPNDKPRDLLHEAVIETDYSVQPQSPPRDTAPPAQDDHRVLRDQPQRLDLTISLRAPALVVVRDYFDTDWQTTVTTTQQGEARLWPMVRTNRIMRGLWLPAGRHHISMRYRPSAFYLGAGISLFTWIALASIAGFRIVAAGR